MAVLPRRYLTAVIVLTLTLSSGLQSSPPDGQSGTAPPPGALAAAVHAGERDRAAQLVLDDVNGADQLFLAYLEQDLAGARTDAGQPGPLEKARRLAGALFAVYEDDFERAIVDWWAKASAAQKAALLPVLRDHAETWRQERAVDEGAAAPVGFDGPLLKRYLELAERFRAVGFGSGELYARLNAANLNESLAWQTWQLAKSLKEEVGEAWAAYKFSIWTGDAQAEAAVQQALAAAERLGLPNLKRFVLTRLAWRALNRDDFEGHVGYFRKALEVVRTMPVKKTMTGRVSRNRYPAEAWFCMAIGRAIATKQKEEAGALYAKGRALSRQHGGETGELAWLTDAMTRSPYGTGLSPDEAAEAEKLARHMNDPGWLARVLMAKAAGLRGSRDYPAAIAAYTEAVELRERAGERAHAASSLTQRAIARIQSNDTTSAAADFDRAILTYRELGLQEVAAGAGIDAGWQLRSRPEEAARYLNAAVSAAQQLDDPALAAEAFMTRAQVVLPNAPADGLQDCMKALEYAGRERDVTGYPQGYLGRMATAAAVLRRAGFVKEAIDIQQRRADTARAQGFPDLEADAYNFIQSAQIFSLGDVAAAADYVRKWQAVLASPGRAVSVNDHSGLAIAYLGVGEPALALEHWALALKTAEASPAGVRFERVTHANIGQTLLQLGDYAGALKEFKAELSVYPQTFQLFGSPIELQKARWYNKVAFTHMLAGDAAKALEASLEAIRQEDLPGSGTALADYYPFYTPGDALATAGRTDEAIAFHTKRIERARKIKSAVGERTALEQLGNTCLRAGKLDAAREAFAAAAAISRRPPGPETGTLASSLLAQAKAESAARQFPAAEALLAEARQAANPYDLNQVWQIEREMAKVLAATGRHTAARERFQLALASLEAARERLRPEEFALRYGVDRRRIYDEFAAYLASRAIDTGLQADAAAALGVVERRRAQVLWDRLATGWARLKPEALPAQLQRVQEAESRLLARQNILRDQFRLPSERRNAALVKTLETDLQKSRDEHARLLSALAQGQFRFSTPEGLPGDVVEQIRRSLGPERVLVEYLVTDEATFAFVVTSAGTAIERVPVGRDELRTRVRAVLQPFYRMGAGDVDVTRLGFDLDAAHTLYKQFVAPLELKVGAARHLAVVPDDALCYLPLEMLVDRMPRQVPAGKTLFAQYEQAGFLLRRYTISYLTGATALLLPPREPRAAGEPARVLVLADPSATQGTPAVEQEDPLRRQLRSATFRGAFTPLSAASSEIEGIRRSFPAKTVTVLTGAEAMESSYKSQAPEQSIIHLSTHAVAADDQPFYSTLVLAPGPGAQEDGFLQAWEVLRHPLRARLVVLSACETALGPVGQGDGMVGLVSAFEQAGARSVVATQWSIDESAAEVMAPFYRSVAAGQGLSDALRGAKLDVVKKRIRLGGTEVSLAHPFFWAPFVLIGADR